MATLPERAFQIWPLLVHAAKHKQILTYEDVNDCTGMMQSGLGRCLEPIQSYCLIKGYPPLTLLVVKKHSGLPGGGFSAFKVDSADTLAENLQKVFTFVWSGKAPDIPELEAAVKALPSNGVA